MSEQITIPKISTPTQIVPFTAIQILPVKTDVMGIIDGDIDTVGIQLKNANTKIEILFEDAVQYCDLTLTNNAPGRTCSLKGLGIDEEDILKYFPNGVYQTYRFLTDKNATGELTFETNGGEGVIDFYNLTGFVVEPPPQQELIPVSAYAAKVRKSALGELTDYPSLIDGNLGESGIMISDKDYQFIQLFYNKEIQFVQITAKKDGRKKPINLSFKGKVVDPDIVADFPEGETVTIQYRIPKGAGILTLFTGQAEGEFTIYEIAAFIKKS